VPHACHGLQSAWHGAPAPTTTALGPSRRGRESFGLADPSDAWCRRNPSNHADLLAVYFVIPARIVCVSFNNGDRAAANRAWRNLSTQRADPVTIAVPSVSHHARRV
jgi:hypothetical protein